MHQDLFGSPRKTLALGVVIGVMLSGIAALAVYLFYFGGPMVDSAYAGAARRSPVCERLLDLRALDPDLVVDFAQFANGKAPGADHIRIGRVTADELCGKAVGSLASSLGLGFDRVASCIGGADTAAQARHCFAE